MHFETIHIPLALGAELEYKVIAFTAIRRALKPCRRFTCGACFMWSQSAAQRAIIVAGCLGMAYTQLTMSPATIEFARSLGATSLHIGILGALPAAMLCMQFVAAVVANHLTYRRWLWLTVTVIHRLSLVPLAVAPLLLDSVDDSYWIVGLIVATAINHALIHFGTPLWLSWMGDYLPHQGLSHYWGVRHLWMQLSAATALLIGAVLFNSTGWDVRFGFAVLIVSGAVLGITDLLFFLKIDEPPVTRVANPRITKVLAAPFRLSGYRSFIGYNCFWQSAVMVGSPFITLFLLSVIGMSLFQILTLWSLSWIGGAMFSRQLGGLIESFGNRPMLVICTALKSTNMAALLLVPTGRADVAFWILAPVFMFDAALNAGHAIASNGFMLKNSPAENRTMYIAAGTAFAGIAGGLASIAAGGLLLVTESWQVVIAGSPFNHFHLLFSLSMVFRLTAIIFALRIEEPASRGTSEVLTMLVGATPFRMLRFPVGLYRAWPMPEQPTANGDQDPQREPTVAHDTWTQPCKQVSS